MDTYSSGHEMNRSSNETANNTFRRGTSKNNQNKTSGLAVSNVTGSLQRALLSGNSDGSRNREEIRIENNNNP